MTAAATDAYARVPSLAPTPAPAPSVDRRPRALPWSRRSVVTALALGAGLFPGAGSVPAGAATWLSGRGVGIIKGTKYLEDAWSFVHWVGASDAGTLAVATDISAVPGWKSSPGLRLLEQDANTAPFVTALQVAKHSPPGAILPIDIWGNKRDQLVVAALQQQRTAGEALDEVTRTAQAELDAALQKAGTLSAEQAV